MPSKKIIAYYTLNNFFFEGHTLNNFENPHVINQATKRERRYSDKIWLLKLHEFKQKKRTSQEIRNVRHEKRSKECETENEETKQKRYSV